MTKTGRIAENHPYLFVIGIFVAESLVALPFVVIFKILELDLEPLRLIIPIAQSAFMIWVVWLLGWFSRAGFTGDVKDVHLYWYPLLIAFVPVLAYGTIEIPAGSLAFYATALIFTGISEETLARGIILPALLPRGKWLALFLAAILFSVGHFTNLFFEDFGMLEMTEKLLVTFGFAVLYGAMFIRTKSIWPLILLHTVHDYSLLTSGTAGPFTVEPLNVTLSIGMALINVAYGVYILMNAEVSSGVESAGSKGK